MNTEGRTGRWTEWFHVFVPWMWRSSKIRNKKLECSMSLCSNTENAGHSVTLFCFHEYQTLYFDAVCHSIYEPRDGVL